MLFRMVRPVQRKGTRNRQFVQRIPNDLRSKIAGLVLDIPLGESVVTVTLSSKADSVRFSLRTDDPTEVKQRQAAAITYLSRVWQSLRSDVPVSLTHRQATALAGELFRAWTREGAVRNIAIEQTPEGGWRRVDDEAESDREETWAAVNAMWERVKSSERASDLEVVVGPLVDRLLLRRGIGKVEGQSRIFLLEGFWKALRDAFAEHRRNAAGDYSPSVAAFRFPEWQDNESRQGLGNGASSRASLTVLINEWWQEAQLLGLKPSTHESYRNTMAKFVAHLGHDDATRVTKDDVLAFKQKRLEAGVSAKTVKDSDLVGLRAVFGWAVANNKLQSNPAVGATLKLGRQPRLRSKGFTDEEASKILKHALGYRGKKESLQLASAKKWVPWLCAFSGARVGEMLQLRKEDVRKQEGNWVATITPLAGTVKSNEARDVVLHPQLVEMGIAEFVERAPPGHLFVTPRGSDGNVLVAIKTARNKIGGFVREVVADPNVDPNHGWRHRFKTVGRELGIADTVLDAIQGHAPKSVGDRYGDVTIKTKAAAVGKFPRYEF